MHKNYTYEDIKIKKREKKTLNYFENCVLFLKCSIFRKYTQCNDEILECLRKYGE